MKKRTVKKFFDRCKKEKISENACMDAVFRNKFKTKKLRDLFKFYFSKEKTYKGRDFCKKESKKNKTKKIL
jgi:hypothetical protein